MMSLNQEKMKLKEIITRGEEGLQGEDSLRRGGEDDGSQGGW